MKKKILIAIIILVIVLVAVLGIFFKNKNTKENKLQNIELTNVEEIGEEQIQSVQSPIAYFTVQACANKYINYLAQKNFDIVYNMLDSQYIETFNITKDNVGEYIETAYEDPLLKIEKMYVKRIDNYNEIYYLKGNLIELLGGEDTTYGEQKEIVLTINIDNENMTFSVVPFGYGGVFYE